MEMGVIDQLNSLEAGLTRHDVEYAELALSAARLDASGEWSRDGSLSMRAWLRRHRKMNDTAIGDLLRHGRFLVRFTPFADAALTGRLSRSQITAMRIAVRRETEVFLDDFALDMVELLAPMDLADTVTTTQTWKARVEALVDTPPKIEAPAEVSFGIDDSGQAVGRFVLSPAGTIDFETALGTARTFHGAGDTRSMTERNADALEDICSFFNANHDRSGTPRHRPHAEIVVEPDGAVRTIDGRVLDTTCARMLLCDCVMHRVLKAGSSILDYGRATRSIPYPTFRALALRDGGCRVDGCDRPVAWTDGHHIEHWEHDGPTDLDNLCLLCRRHHRLMHTNGWTLTMDPVDYTVTVTTPTGDTLTSRPRGSPPTLQLLATATI